MTNSRPRRLLLCLDGVPHRLILEAKHRGLFASFGTPSRLLSPFPTMTNVALSTMFAATPPAGYESCYFDRDAREMRGGIGKYLGRRTPDKRPSSYMEELDYQEPLAFEFLIYVAPEKVWRADMQRFREKFREAPKDRDYFAFLKATDGLLHAQGPARLAVALESLDQILREIQKFCGQETEIVLFSDHGMNLEENKKVDFASTLRSEGFSVSSRLNSVRPNTVAIPTFGLCSYAAVYCANEELVPRVARILATVKGVDFVIHREGEAVLLESAAGVAQIDRQNSSYRYRSFKGDPLELDSIAHELGGGFIDDTRWFEHTNAHIYPDAVANIHASMFSARVKHTADILVSLQDGYYYGWATFARMVRLFATHGNALAASSNAFMMSTHRQLPACIRSADARPWLKG
jgi:hypothetical protein